MALDGAFLSLLKREISNCATGSKVDKIFQPTRDELVLLLRSKSFSGRLLISARPSAARVHFTEYAPENPLSPPMFCMLLRKRLLGARLCSVCQPGLERVLELQFEALNELGDTVSFSLTAEFMGRQPNLIFIDGDRRIIDALRRSSAEASRLIMPGALYQLPPAQNKLDFSATETPVLFERICAASSELPAAILSVLDGASPLVCRELAYLTARGEECHSDRLSPEQAARLHVFLDRQKDLLKNGGTPTMLLRAGEKPFDFTYMNISQYGSAAVTRTFDSYSVLLDAYYAERERVDRLHASSHDLLKVLTNAIERISKKINLQKADLEKCGERERLRIFGELIKANLHTLTRGDSVCEAQNYYEPDCPVIRIPMNPALSPTENAQKYFKSYRKAHTAEQMLTKLIEEGQQELVYLESVFDALARAESEREIAEIRDELSSAHYLKRPKTSAGKKQALLPPHKYCSKDGFTILVGRNNRQNDELTLRTAQSNDIWLHVKNIPGSHTIILTENRTPPDGTIEEAAQLAARHSRAKETGSAEVDYTLVKYVKKIPGSKPGMVTYDKYKTVFVHF